MAACQLAEQCRDRDSEGFPADADSRRLCRKCETESTRDVRQLPFDFRDLSQLLADGTTSETQIAWQPASVPPINLGVDALLRRIEWVVTFWEVPVREAARLAEIRSGRTRPGFAVLRAAEIISPRVDLLAGLRTYGYADGPEAEARDASGLDALAELRQLHRFARTALGLTRRTFRLPGDCSDCGAWALRRRDGAETVWCDDCGRRWTLDDYRTYVRLMTSFVTRSRDT